MINHHSSVCIRKSLERVDSNKAKKRECEISEPNLEFAFEQLISLLLIEDKAKSRGTEIAVPKKIHYFFASFTSRVEFSLTKTRLRNC